MTRQNRLQKSNTRHVSLLLLRKIEQQPTKIEPRSVCTPEQFLGILAAKLWQAAEQGSPEWTHCKVLKACDT